MTIHLVDPGDSVVDPDEHQEAKSRDRAKPNETGHDFYDVMLEGLSTAELLDELAGHLSQAGRVLELVQWRLGRP